MVLTADFLLDDGTTSGAAWYAIWLVPMVLACIVVAFRMGREERVDGLGEALLTILMILLTGMIFSLFPTALALGAMVGLANLFHDHGIATEWAAVVVGTAVIVPVLFFIERWMQNERTTDDWEVRTRILQDQRDEARELFEERQRGQRDVGRDQDAS